MKAISLWQPWASAIAVGAKRVETRSWPTGYRGLLAIHAAKRMVKWEMINFGCRWMWRAVLAPLLDGDRMLWGLLPFGAIVAVCRLVDCRPTNSFTVAELDQQRTRPGRVDSWTERSLGDFSLGRYGWVLDRIMPLKAPLPYRGMQGLFDVPDQLLEKAFEA